MRNQLISIIGVDGSGKTTLCKNIAKTLNDNGYQVKHVWGGYECCFLLPFVLAAKFIFMQNMNPYEDYSTYHDKIKGDAKIGAISKIYRKMTLLEYLIQIFIKIQIPLWQGNTVIADRYVYDILVNLAVNLNYNELEFQKSLKFLDYCRIPEYNFFLDTPIDVAYKRKNDIPSTEYLIFRRKYYLLLANHFNMIRLNGSKSVEELTKIVEGFIKDDKSM